MSQSPSWKLDAYALFSSSLRFIVSAMFALLACAIYSV
jgi:hypothetical protein